MKKSWVALALMGMVGCVAVSCGSDDSDYSGYVDGIGDNDDTDDNGGGTAGAAGDTIFVVYNGTSAQVTGSVSGCSTTVTGADVTVVDATATADAAALVLSLSGSTSNGSLTVYRQKKYTLSLNGVSITNNDGPAINNQCGKALYVDCVAGTTNTLTDGATYATRSIDQKGTLFSEGQIYFTGSGTLNVNANSKNAIASDDYITIQDAVVINTVTASSGSNGIKVNDGLFIDGGTLTVSVASDGGRGIRSDTLVAVTAGNVSITTTGNCKIETTNGVRDTTSAACIKSNGEFTMSGGTLTLTSTGDGGKGINSDADVSISGGSFTATTTGGKSEGKPKAVKSATAIVVSGGSFTAKVDHSWACDNGTDSELPADRVTVKGTPATQVLTKKSVAISYR